MNKQLLNTILANERKAKWKIIIFNLFIIGLFIFIFGYVQGNVIVKINIDGNHVRVLGMGILPIIASFFGLMMNLIMILGKIKLIEDMIKMVDEQ